MKLGIIGAMTVEIESLKAQMQDLEDDLVIEDGVAVAVDVSSLPWFKGKTEGSVYLAFTAKTEKLQVCKDLWNMISEK